MTYSIIQKSRLEGAKRLDAEYYQPEYLNIDSKIKKFKLLGSIADKIFSGPFGSTLKSESYRESGVPFIRIGDISDVFIERGSLVFISESEHKRIHTTHLKPGNIVLSKIGTVGRLSVVPEELGEVNISENNIGIRLDSFNHEQKTFLLLFLISRFGQLQLVRKASGNIQLKLNVADVESIKIPEMSESLQEEICRLYDDMVEQRRRSNDLYSKAESLLLEELGLTDFEKDKSLSWTVDFSDLKTAHRMDAEYFQPKYEKLISKLKNKNTKFLGDLVSMKKGIETGSEAYRDEGKPFIRVSSLSRNGVEDGNQKYLSEELYQKLKRDFEPKVGEILLTKDATLGVAYHVQEPISGIISGGIMRLQLKEEIEQEYLALCINSIVGQMQVERDAGGSVIAHWRPEQINDMRVPILPKATQQRIAELVRQSHEARKKSQELLEEAKHRVEEAIEQGANNG